MSSDEQKKWDQRYTNHPVVEPRAAEVLACNLHLLPSKGKALDLACGLGANAILLAKSGLQTSAWDISPVALKDLQNRSRKLKLRIETQTRDVVKEPPATSSFDLIVISRFLDRGLFPHLIDAVKAGGLLFYQTFTAENTGTGGPSNADFLLKKNELLHLFRGLTVVSFRDEGRIGSLQQGLRNESWIIVKKEEKDK